MKKFILGFLIIGAIGAFSGCGLRGGVCNNSCQWAYDGVCDDGGSGSSFGACDYGSDCADCGSR